MNIKKCVQAFLVVCLCNFGVSHKLYSIVMLNNATNYCFCFLFALVPKICCLLANAN